MLFYLNLQIFLLGYKLSYHYIKIKKKKLTTQKNMITDDTRLKQIYKDCGFKSLIPYSDTKMMSWDITSNKQQYLSRFRRKHTYNDMNNDIRIKKKSKGCLS
jgi:hypothetical protein